MLDLGIIILALLVMGYVAWGLGRRDVLPALMAALLLPALALALWREAALWPSCAFTIVLGYVAVVNYRRKYRRFT
jgi:hypothetical protein